MRLEMLDTERCVGCQNCMFACTRRQGEGGLSKTCIGVRSIGGTERGFKVIVCRACENPPRVRVCPTGALIFSKLLRFLVRLTRDLSEKELNVLKEHL